jgi:hypothetical protein
MAIRSGEIKYSIKMAPVLFILTPSEIANVVQTWKFYIDVAFQFNRYVFHSPYPSFFWCSRKNLPLSFRYWRDSYERVYVGAETAYEDGGVSVGEERG